MEMLKLNTKENVEKDEDEEENDEDELSKEDKKEHVGYMYKIEKLEEDKKNYLGNALIVSDTNKL